MTIEQSEALENLRVVRETIDKSKTNQYWKEFVAESRKLFLLTGILVVIAAGLSLVFMENQFPLWSHWIVWILALAISGSYKGVIFSRLGKRNGISFTEYIKKITPKEFFLIDIPLEITGTVGLIYCVVSGRYEFILPLIILGGGHIMNALGVLFKTKSYIVLGYVWQVIGLAAFFMPFVSPAILAGTAFGIVMILYGMFAGVRRG